MIYLLQLKKYCFSVFDLSNKKYSWDICFNSAFSVMLFFYLSRCILYLLILYEGLILGKNFFNKFHRDTYHKRSNESLMTLMRSLT